jgi:NADH-quinone oxidoreductase subunit C
MTVLTSGLEIASKINAKFPEALVDSSNLAITIKSEYLIEVVAFLKNSPDDAYDFLDDITSVDYLDFFEIIYRFTSIQYNRSLVLKTRCLDRENPEVPSLIGLWKGADFLEREIYDLMGISFKGHPNMKRIFLWEGFKGYPLRKDYL